MPMNKGKHQMLLRRLGAPAGGQMLGANLTEVAPEASRSPSTTTVRRKKGCTS